VDGNTTYLGSKTGDKNVKVKKDETTTLAIHEGRERSRPTPCVDGHRLAILIDSRA
jgi:hypothetical protein